jgi:sulfoxide reductase heme-binding subunit YedZ
MLQGSFYLFTSPPDIRHRASMSSAYVAMVFLGWSLFLGPLNVLRSRANPVSFDLRRDVSIWAGIFALIHTAIGLTVHLRGRTWMYFFKKLHPPVLQNTQFGFANYAGLVAALLFGGLLLISNDLSLRSLGVKRWKTLQRTSYIAFALTLAHGWAYQAIEKRKLPWMTVFWMLAAFAIITQLAAIVRRRNRQPAAKPQARRT